MGHAAENANAENGLWNIGTLCRRYGGKQIFCGILSKKTIHHCTPKISVVIWPREQHHAAYENAEERRQWGESQHHAHDHAETAAAAPRKILACLVALLFVIAF